MISDLKNLWKESYPQHHKPLVVAKGITDSSVSVDYSLCTVSLELGLILRIYFGFVFGKSSQIPE